MTSFTFQDTMDYCFGILPTRSQLKNLHSNCIFVFRGGDENLDGGEELEDENQRQSSTFLLEIFCFLLVNKLFTGANLYKRLLSWYCAKLDH